MGGGLLSVGTYLDIVFAQQTQLTAVLFFLVKIDSKMLLFCAVAVISIMNYERLLYNLYEVN